MTLSSVIVTYRKMITLWLAALTTVGSIAGGSLWLFQEVAWKRDVDRVKQELVAKFDRKTDIGLLEILKIRRANVKSDFDIYDGAIRTYQAKETLTIEEFRNKRIFEEQRDEAKIQMDSINRRIEFLERKIDGGL